MSEFDKIKFSHHQQEHVQNNDKGHIFTVADAESVINHPASVTIQPNTRLRYSGSIFGKAVDVIVSVATSVSDSATYRFARVVTMFRKRK